MRIKKMYQGTVPENKILDTYSNSPTDTYSCNYVNVIDNKFSYSDNEKVIGKDTDGKNVYRRTFKGTLGNGDFTVITNLYNNTNIILKNAYGSLRKEGSGAIEIGSYVNGTFYSGLYVHQEEIQCYHGSGVRGGTYDITLEFTKIND